MGTVILPPFIFLVLSVEFLIVVAKVIMLSVVGLNVTAPF